MMNTSSDIWVVVPAFNEGPVIGEVLERLAATSYNVVVVDDGSSDDTAQQAARYPVVVLRHACNLGQGAALQTGIRYALQRGRARYVVTFDSDGQHNPGEIERLVAPLRTGAYDVVLGSRFLHAGGVVNIKPQKRALLKLAVLFTRVTTGLKVTDTHNGLRALTAEGAAKIQIVQNRMAHASEILSQIAARRLRYCEVPITITYTEYSLAKGQAILNSINIMWELMTGRIR